MHSPFLQHKRGDFMKTDELEDSQHHNNSYGESFTV